MLYEVITFTGLAILLLTAFRAVIHLRRKRGLNRKEILRNNFV